MPSARPRASRRRLQLAGVVVTFLIALPAVAFAGRAWQLDVSPSTIFIDTETNIRLTVTNTGDDGGGSEISCVRVQVPATFEITDVRILSIRNQTSGTAFDAWIAVWPGGTVVTFKEPKDDYPLIGSTAPLDEAVFRITGTSSSLLAMTWTVTAADKPDHADTTTCGSGATSKSPTILVIPLSGPTPTPTPAPTPTPTPAPTPTPTPAPTPTPTPAPTKTPTPTPTRPPIIVVPSLPVPTLPPILPTARPTATPAQTTPPEPTVEPSGRPRPSPPGAAATDEPRGSDDPGVGVALVIPGNRGPGEPEAVFDGAVFDTLNGLPGGLVAWAYPAFAISVPGLLLLLAVAAQALGAFAWLPLIRRRLGEFGLRRAPEDG